MRLPRTTLPSDLHLVQKYIDNQLVGFFQDETTAPNIETTFNIALIADDLRMRVLQVELLTQTILQMLNKCNVIKFLTPAHERLKKKKEQYKVEIVEVVSRKNSKKHRRRKRRNNNSSSNNSEEDDDGEPSDSYDSCDDVEESSNSSSESESGC